MRRYSKEEDRIILDNLRDVDANIHRDVLKLCCEIRAQLPDRSPEGIRERWYSLIGKKVYTPVGKKTFKLSALLTQREKWRYSRPRYRRSDRKPPNTNVN